MLILKPIAHETIWGGEKLIPYAPEPHKTLGHLYSLVTNGEFESVILNGKYKGLTFKQYFDENKSDFNLDGYERFPFITALVDPKEDLSIQVHPDDKCAKQVENREFGKSESWYFIQAPEKGWLYNGCKVNSKEQIKNKIQENKVEEEVIDKLSVKSGDYVFVEQGTIHAATCGALFYEIEENCNITYRFYDFDRVDNNGSKRELHIEKALMAINPNLKSKTQRYEGKDIQERFYSTKLLKNIEQYQNNSNTLEVLTILEGETELEGIMTKRGTSIVLEPGESINLNTSTFISARPKIKRSK